MVWDLNALALVSTIWLGSPTIEVEDDFTNLWLENFLTITIIRCKSHSEVETVVMIEDIIWTEIAVIDCRKYIYTSLRIKHISFRVCIKNHSDKDD